MGYRNDLEAAMARIEALERDLQRARAAELRVPELEAEVAILKMDAERAAVTARHEREAETARLRAELEAERLRVRSLEDVVAAQEGVIEALRNAR